MEITLKIKNKNKKYDLPRPNFALMRLTAELYELEAKGEFFSSETKNEELLKDLKTSLEYIIKAFGNQFTVEEFEEGYYCQDMTEFYMLVHQVMAEVTVDPKRVKNLPMLEKIMTEGLEQIRETYDVLS